VVELVTENHDQVVRALLRVEIVSAHRLGSTDLTCVLYREMGGGLIDRDLNPAKRASRLRRVVRDTASANLRRRQA
jgi:hypothetical protein